jgi:light-regulated signal transduction histidine kinase (bacteriophytochrome)
VELLGRGDAGPVRLADRDWTVALHRTDRHLLAELEPANPDALPAGEVLALLSDMAAQFERATDVETLCARAAAAFRQLTGFDRVMIYRFVDDDAGRVVAEDRAAHLGTFLHHHFPASDIPPQARALYVRNRTRAIPDAAYVPQPVRPPDAGLEAVDLSDVGVRSVSPIHVQYLKNMGVGASASISIVRDGLLWGLVACHHDTPKLLHADTRLAAATLAGGLARQLRAKEEAETYRERLRLRASEDNVLPQLALDGASPAVLKGCAHELARMMAADGLAFLGRGSYFAYGHCPPEALVREAAAWVAPELSGGQPYATDRLPQDFAPAALHARQASGLMATGLAEEGGTLMWFRAELVQEIEWAGNPHKAVPLTPGATLTPRSSFESWTQTVGGRSRAWTLEELDSAARLRRAFAEADTAARLKALNTQLRASLEEKDALVRQKDVLIKEVNHRVQNSLQLVSSFLRLQARTSGEEAAASLAEAQARLSAVALVHRRLYADDRVDSVELGRYLEELVGDLKGTLGPDWGAGMKLDLAQILVPTDRAVNIGLVLTELVINATKYAYDGAPGPLWITLERVRGRFQLIVADAGRGKGSGPAGGTGFGGRMLGAVVGGLGGELAYLDNGPGCRAVLTAPIRE